MKVYLVIVLLFSAAMAFAQVGIGTTTPTKDLDVNGQMRVRDLPAISGNAFIVSDSHGNIGSSQEFVLSDIETLVATNNVDFVNTGVIIANNINIGMSMNIIIPANKEALVIVDYSVPVGISSFTAPIGYYGIRFLKNGGEEQSGSRKSTTITNGSSNMTTISGKYIDSISSSSSDQSITYNLDGYVEQLDAGTHTYRFNMWSPIGVNFNWGRSAMTVMIFLK